MKWEGVFPALLTPFSETEELDVPMFERNLRAQLEAGVHGLIIGGSLGEASTLRRAEKKVLVEHAVQSVSGKLPVVLNIAECSTEEAVAAAQNAEKWGADALMLLPPMRYKSDERETLQFIRKVATSSGLPIMLYNNPVDYRVEFSVQMLERLADLKNIQAIKESTRDISNVTRIIAQLKDRYSILCGVDTIALEALLMGAKGWIAGLCDAFPLETVAIYQYAIHRELDQALSIHRWFLPLLELDLHPKFVQYIKLAASYTGIGSEYVRAPRLTLSGDERKEISSIIESSLETRPALKDFQQSIDREPSR